MLCVVNTHGPFRSDRHASVCILHKYLAEAKCKLLLVRGEHRYPVRNMTKLPEKRNFICSFLW